MADNTSNSRLAEDQESLERQRLALEGERLVLERERLAIERLAAEAAAELGRAELDHKRAELDLRREETERGRWRNPLFLGVVAAVLGLGGNIAVAIYNGIIGRNQQHQQFLQNIAVEETKARAGLVREAIKTGDPDTAATNLSFFLDAGLIDDPSGVLTAYLRTRRPGSGVFLPTELAYRTLQPPPTESPEVEVFASHDRCDRVVRAGARMPHDPRSTIRLATWNLMWFGRPELRSDEDLRWFACTLTWLDADVVAVQELDGRENFERAFRKLSDFLVDFGAGRWRFDLQDCRSSHMLGFLYRVERVSVSDARDIWYLNASAGGPEEACSRLRPGRAVRATLAVPGESSTVWLVNVHAKAGSKDRDFRLREILRERLSKLLDDEAFQAVGGRLVVMGDFNTIGNKQGLSDEGEVRRLRVAAEALAPRLRLLTSGDTCSYLSGGSCKPIDHVLSSEQMADAHAVSSPGYCSFARKFGLAELNLLVRERLSDHCPVVVDLMVLSGIGAIHRGAIILPKTARRPTPIRPPVVNRR